MIEKKRCSGCYACYNICPQNAIEMKQDKEGFYYPYIIQNKCIGCGLCDDVCPNQHKNINISDITSEVYGAWSKSEEIRLNSTSGGIFSELAINILDNNGYVCGAKYNEEFMVEHYIIRKKDELDKIRQSKYVQSSLGFIYRSIEKYLSSNKYILFCGTPCQCSGLINYLDIKKINRDKLLVVDFVCRGVNSPKVYRKFLDELENIYKSKVKKVWFKNKEYGWNRFSTRIDFENGKVYLEDRKSDIYMRGYIEKNLYMRPSCSECNYKSSQRTSDITLADFWGIKMNNSSLDTDKGTSLVIINSNKGKEIWKNILQRIIYEDKRLEDATKGNVCLYKPIEHSKERSELMKEIDNMNIIDNIKRLL